jgi:hypothetical protein
VKQANNNQFAVGDSKGFVQVFNSSNGIGSTIKAPASSLAKLWNAAMADGDDAITTLEFSLSGRSLFVGDASGSLSVCWLRHKQARPRDRQQRMREARRGAYVSNSVLHWFVDSRWL